MSSLVESVCAIVRNCRPDNIQRYETIYKIIHSNPELSHQENETAALIVHHLTSLTADFDIRRGIGGYGIVAIFENGPGKAVLLRADMDALPVREITGLPYASQKQVADGDGVLHPVMHGRYPLQPCYYLHLVVELLTPTFSV